MAPRSRATPSHTALSLGGFSSARLSEPERHTGRETLIEPPKNVPVEIEETDAGTRFQGGHDGFVATQGLTHARTLELSFDGRGLAGEDLLVGMSTRDKKQFNHALDGTQLGGVPFDIRFHLHPDVDATVDMGGTAVSMALKSGEIWVFRHDGKQQLRLEPSVYLETTRLKPRAALQIVLSGVALTDATRVRWTLSKAQETAIGVRDITLDDPYADSD